MCVLSAGGTDTDIDRTDELRHVAQLNASVVWLRDAATYCCFVTPVCQLTDSSVYARRYASMVLAVECRRVFRLSVRHLPVYFLKMCVVTVT